MYSPLRLYREESVFDRKFPKYDILLRGHNLSAMLSARERACIHQMRINFGTTIQIYFPLRSAMTLYAGQSSWLPLVCDAALIASPGSRPVPGVDNLGGLGRRVQQRLAISLLKIYLRPCVAAMPLRHQTQLTYTVFPHSPSFAAWRVFQPTPSRRFLPAKFELISGESFGTQ